MKDYVIVGNGIAGVSAASKIRELDPDGRIQIFSAESHPFYTRIRLPEFISGTIDHKALTLHGEKWYGDRGIELHLSEPIESIYSDKRLAISKNGSVYHYDELLLATGGSSFIPPLKGSDKRGVFSLRTIDDGRRIIDFLSSATRPVVLGGGLLGLEAGNGLRRRGLEVTVVEFFPRLLPRQLDPQGATFLQRMMEDMGFKFILGAKSKEILGSDGVKALLLEDGRVIDCDMILVSAGVKPNLELAVKMGLKIQRAIVVDDRLETSIPHIFAAGDCAEHRGIYYGIWPAAQRQGEIAGINMAGGKGKYRGTVMNNRLKVAGIDLFSAGDIDPDGRLRNEVEVDISRNIYRKIVFDNGNPVGCILLGDIGGYREILRKIEESNISR